MALTALLAMVRKDLALFLADRRALVMAFAAPIAIASFFGSIFPGPSASSEPSRIAVHLVDQDGSAIAVAIVAGVKGDKNLKVTVASAEAARAAVRRVDAELQEVKGHLASSSARQRADRLQEKVRAWREAME